MKKHALRRLMSAFRETFWAITPEKLAMINDFMELRADGEMLTREQILDRIGATESAPLVQMAGSVAVMNLFGVVAQRMNMIQESSGGVSTEQVADTFAKLVNDSSITTIVLNCDSPGGAVPGVESLANEIFNARSSKRVVAISNPMMCSAMYWIATAAGEVWATIDSCVGSVGVACIHTEVSKQRIEDGITDTIITSGANKFEGNEYQPLTADARAHKQKQADEIGGRFTAAVARNRGVSVATVAERFGQGRSLSASEALAAGMIDRIGTLEELLATLDAGKAAQTASKPMAAKRNPAQFRGTNMNRSVFSAMVVAGLVPFDADDATAIAVLDNHFKMKGIDKPATDEGLVAALKPVTSTAVTPTAQTTVTAPRGEFVAVEFIHSQVMLAKQMGTLSADDALSLIGEFKGGNFTAAQVAERVNAVGVKNAGPVNGGVHRTITNTENDSRANRIAACRNGFLMGMPGWQGNEAPKQIHLDEKSPPVDFKPQRSDQSLATPAAVGRDLLAFCGATPMEIRELSDQDVVRIINGDADGFRFMASDVAYNTTGMYRNITTDSIYAVLRQGYSFDPPTYEQWCAQDEDFQNFKSKYILQFGEMPDPRVIPENGEFEEAFTIDDKIGYKPVNWGRQFSWTWEMQLADRFNAFGRLISEFGSTFPRKRDRLIYSHLLSNPVMESDGVALFDDSAHGNLSTGAITYYKTAFSAMRKKMAIQRGLIGNDAGDETTTLGTKMKNVLVPEALFDTIREFLFATADISGSNSGSANIWRGSVNPIPCPIGTENTGGSDTAIYGLADKNILPTIQYANLAGHSAPVVRRQQNQNRLGVAIQIYQPFAFKVVDYRGIQKHAGA